MGVTIVKEKEVQEVAESLDEGAKAVDTYYKTKAAIEEYEQNKHYLKLKKEHEEAKKTLIGMADLSVGEDEELQIDGEEGSIIVGAKSKVRSIADKEGVFKALGADFKKVATVSMANLDKYLNPDQLSKLVKTARTGARKLRVPK